MLLEGSCHCGAVQFSVVSANPYPYQRCYCSICRKTQGGGGYAINLSGDARTLTLKGGEDVTVYNAIISRGGGEDPRHSTAERHFCAKCGSALWLFSPEWPDLIHPFASAIDTNLPVPPEHTHLFLDSKATWVEVEAHPGDKLYKEYPEESIAQWHERTGLEDRDQ
jgi:hypothetical protein